MKSIKALCSTLAAITALSAFSLTAFADETTVTTTTPAPSFSFDMDQYLSTYTTASTYDYYGDPYYDTDGNAELINNQNVIYSSARLQFISVTTKDGHVFYIIIDYADTDGDNVYFLNKVDDFDLYSLLYTGDENVLDSYKDQSTVSATGTGANAQQNGNQSTTSTKITEPADAEQPKPGMSERTKLLLVMGVIFVVVLGVAFTIKVISIKKNRSIPTDDYMEEDEEEIVEDFSDFENDEVEIQ